MSGQARDNPSMATSSKTHLAPIEGNGTLNSDMNLNQLLLARNDWLSQAILSGVKQSDAADLSAAQTRLLAVMAGKPTSISELARRMGVTRQAVHKTVIELERRGVLRVHDDPQRGNAKLVIYTEKGRELNRQGARIINSIESRLTAQLGSTKVQHLKKLLAADWGATPNS
jgi:DNA-binding MarR family transcriptional regulator